MPTGRVLVVMVNAVAANDTLHMANVRRNVTMLFIRSWGIISPTFSVSASIRYYL